MTLSSVLEFWNSLRPNSRPSPLHFELLGYQMYIHSFSVFSRAQVSPLCSNSISPPAYLMSPHGHLKNISDLHSIFKMELRAPTCFSSTIPISVNDFETRNLEVTYLASKIPLLYPTPPATHTHPTSLWFLLILSSKSFSHQPEALHPFTHNFNQSHITFSLF